MSWFFRRRKRTPDTPAPGAAESAYASEPANGLAEQPPVGAQPPVTPINRDRLEALLKANDWRYRVDEDGDLTGRWDDDLISFMLRGEQDEMLNIMGMMLEDVPMDRLDEARFAIDEWHREHLWPVCFWRENDDAGMTFTIGGAVAVDWEPGATDDQILQQIRCGLSTCGQAFADFRDRLGLEPYEEPKD